MNKKIRLKQLIEAHIRNTVEQSWIGSKHPSDHARVEEDYQRSKRKLEEYIDAKM